MDDFSGRIVTEFRENAGHVETAGFGDRLVLLHHVGARSGTPRLSPVMALPDGDSWLIAASKAGAPENPAWFHNLRAHPDVEIEVPADGTIRTVPVRATVLDAAERDAAWQRFVAAAPGFGQYQERTDRVIPVLRLSPR